MQDHVHLQEALPRQPLIASQDLSSPIYVVYGIVQCVHESILDAFTCDASTAVNEILGLAGKFFCRSCWVKGRDAKGDKLAAEVAAKMRSASVAQSIVSDDESIASAHSSLSQSSMAGSSCEASSQSSEGLSVSALFAA